MNRTDLERRLFAMRSVRFSRWSDPAVILLSDPRWPWRVRKAEQEKLLWLEELRTQFPTLILVLDPIDEDVSGELLHAALVERRGPAFVVVAQNLAAVLSRLHRGNWALFFLAADADSAAARAAESPIDLNALPALVKRIGAEVGIVSRPDDTEWLVAGY